MKAVSRADSGIESLFPSLMSVVVLQCYCVVFLFLPLIVIFLFISIFCYPLFPCIHFLCGRWVLLTGMKHEFEDLELPAGC